MQSDFLTHTAIAVLVISLGGACAYNVVRCVYDRSESPVGQTQPMLNFDATDQTAEPPFVNELQ